MFIYNVKGKLGVKRRFFYILRKIILMLTHANKTCFLNSYRHSLYIAPNNGRGLWNGLYVQKPCTIVSSVHELFVRVSIMEVVL